MLLERKIRPLETMEAYKRWVRTNRDFVRQLGSLINGLTWLLPDEFGYSEIGPEAGFVKFCIITSGNDDYHK